MQSGTGINRKEEFMAFATAQDAEKAFYSAFAAADLEAMKATWANTDIVCIHPAAPLLQDPDDIFRSWDQVLSRLGAVKLRVEVIYRQAREDHAVHVVREHFSVRTGKNPEPIIATNVYRKGPEGWLLHVHHASPTPPQPPMPKGTSVH